MLSPTTLSRKTKQEVLEEYKNLKEKFEELNAASKMVFKTENQEAISKIKEQTKGDTTKSIADFKESVSSDLGELSNKLGAALSILQNKILSEADKFDELQKAIALSKKNLEAHYNIQVAAEALENLVAEYEKKKKELEEEAGARKEAIEAELAAQKRNWEREQEEYDYNKEIARQREADLYKEEKTRREAEIAARETELQKREEELQNLKSQVESFPEKLQKEITAKEEVLTKRLTAGWEARVKTFQKDWESEKQVYEMKLENLQNQIAKQEAEISALKEEAESSNKKAQELAVKVIESGAKIRHENTAPEKNSVQGQL